MYIYIYIYVVYSKAARSSSCASRRTCSATAAARTATGIIVTIIIMVHPLCCLRFVSDWTQPVDIILSADSELICYYLSNKGAWATQPLEQILDSELLLRELSVRQILRMIISKYSDE